MEKNSKEYSVVFLVEGKKFKLQILSRTSSLLCSRLRTRSALSLSLQHLETVPTPNLAELVLRIYSVRNQWFFGGRNTFSLKKKFVFISIELCAQ